MRLRRSRWQGWSRSAARLEARVDRPARILAYGIIALVWSQAAEGRYLPKGGVLGLVLTASLVLAILAVILDFAQDLVGYRYVRERMLAREREIAEGTSPGTPLFASGDRDWRLRQGLFTAKLGLAGLATLLLAASVVSFLLAYVNTPDG